MRTRPTSSVRSRPSKPPFAASKNSQGSGSVSHRRRLRNSVTALPHAIPCYGTLTLRIGAPTPKVVHSAPDYPVWPIIKRTAAMLIIVGGIFVGIQERGRLASHVSSLPDYQKQLGFEQPLLPTQAIAVAPSPPAKPKPLRPTDYGVYAVDNDLLIELRPLPGRAARYPCCGIGRLEDAEPHRAAERTPKIYRVPPRHSRDHLRSRGEFAATWRRYGSRHDRRWSAASRRNTINLGCPFGSMVWLGAFSAADTATRISGGRPGNGRSSISDHC